MQASSVSRRSTATFLTREAGTDWKRDRQRLQGQALLHVHHLTSLILPRIVYSEFQDHRWEHGSDNGVRQRPDNSIPLVRLLYMSFRSRTLNNRYKENSRDVKKAWLLLVKS